MINLDFSSVPSREPIDEGMYVLEIANVTEKLSSNNNPMLVVEYDVIGVEGKRKLWENYVLIEKSMWKLKEFFNALGLDTSAVVELDVVELIGESLRAKVIQESYKDDTVNRIKKVYPLEG